MKVTHSKLRQIIREEMRDIAVVPRMRGQNDGAGYASGLYEEDPDVPSDSEASEAAQDARTREADLKNPNRSDTGSINESVDRWQVLAGI